MPACAVVLATFLANHPAHVFSYGPQCFNMAVDSHSSVSEKYREMFPEYDQVFINALSSAVSFLWTAVSSQKGTNSGFELLSKGKRRCCKLAHRLW